MDKETVRQYQQLINTGMAWKLEGDVCGIAFSVGRLAMDLIRAGYCMLGKEGHRDYCGNYVPSRYEVKKGTLGSAAYCKQRRQEREDN